MWNGGGPDGCGGDLFSARWQAILRGSITHGIIHRGIIHRGIIHSGIIHNGITHSGIINRGIIHSGIIHSGIIHRGIIQNGIIRSGIINCGVIDGWDRFGVCVWCGWVQGVLEANETGVHTFFVAADDGVRLWLDDEIFLDKWGDQAFFLHFFLINDGAAALL